MSLTQALSIARSSLSVSALQTSTVSRNISGSNEAFYSRKTAEVATFQGGVRVAGIGRAADPSLMRALTEATSEAAGLQALAEGLDTLAATYGDPGDGQSPAGMLAALRDALQQLSATPGNTTMAQAVLDTARDMVRTLNDGAAATQTVRQQADSEMAEGVTRLNTLLARLEPLNAEIVSGTQFGKDVTRQMDERDRIVAGIAEQLGIRTRMREDNDLVIFTESGLTLFETTARSVSFDAQVLSGAAATGNPVLVDGVPVIGPDPVMAVRTGRLYGLAQLRDDAAPAYQAQLDEIARGLIETFAESDQNAPPALPDIAGLFTWPGGPAVPATATIEPGLASGILVNPNADPLAGGTLERIRDGGIGDPGNPAYVYNTGGGAGYSDRLTGLIDAMSAPRGFDPAARADTSAGLIGFASGSVAWLEEQRSTTTAEQQYRTTLGERLTETLSNRTGVNIDEEMTVILELERTYQASSRLIATVDQMLQQLLAIVR